MHGSERMRKEVEKDQGLQGSIMSKHMDKEGKNKDGDGKDDEGYEDLEKVF